MRTASDPTAVSALSLVMSRSERHLAQDHPLDLALSDADVHIACAAAWGNPLFEGLMRLLSGRMAWRST